MDPAVVLFVVIAAVIILIAVAGFRIVRPFEQGLIELLGKYRATVNPGLRFVIPFLQRILKVDMREQVIDVPPQEVITKDNVAVTVDAVIYFEATDPVKLKYAVGNFMLAITKLAQTNLRNVIGDLQLDEALVSREIINSKLRTILDDATDKWGTRVVRVEIQRIEPPPDVTNAMHRQMKAERDRRAAVTEAEGERAAAILTAEGVKEAAILTAAGRAEAVKIEAEAEKFRQLTVAEGEGQAIETVFAAIHEGNPTQDLLAVRYLEALQGIADGQATKIFLPLETSGVLGSVAALGELFKEGNTPAASSDSGTAMGTSTESAPETQPPPASYEPAPDDPQ